MTLDALPRPIGPRGDNAGPDRFRLNRAGILNVWQYDDQEFQLADGRMLLRGANGAGKSKTLEILLPFALDGDKARITASARHHTSLLWLMTDGYEGQARVGYVWVEFLRRREDGTQETYTCGVGIRASASARTASAWFFTTPQRIGHDLLLEDAGGPLPRPRLEEAIGGDGQVFQQAAAYKEHVGRTLFGLDVDQYDDVLRLLYWLRQPQIGEDIEPARLAGQLAQALPQLDEQSVRAAGETFDELSAFGEQIERREAAAEALGGLAGAYARYARSTVAARGRRVLTAVREERRLRNALGRRQRELDALNTSIEETEAVVRRSQQDLDSDHARIRELEASPEARDQRRLGELGGLADQQRGVAREATAGADHARAEHDRRHQAHTGFADDIRRRLTGHAGRIRELDSRQRSVGIQDVLATPALLETERLEHPETADALVGTLEESRRLLTASTGTIGQRRAAVVVVRDAGQRLEAERRRAEEKEDRAAEAEQRWEQARTSRVAAEEAADRLLEQHVSALRDWATAEAAPPLGLPDELTPETLSTLSDLARQAAHPRLTELRARSQVSATRRDNAQAVLAELTTQRVAIAGERDPAPPAPALGRTPRADGAPLWRLVDFADRLDAPARAGLEAALQAAGLLDAWVRPDGAVLDADSRDVLLQPGPPGVGRTLADVLRPDPAPGSEVAADVVTGILRRVRLGPGADASAWVDIDGAWSLTPLRGRAEKQSAQYVGATARAQERQRRLDEVDAALTEAEATRRRAESEIDDLGRQTEALEAWARRVPSPQALLTAWTKAEERRATEDTEERANATAQRLAHEAREVVARAHEELERLAAQHDVPSLAGPLAALEERLRQLAEDVRGTETEIAHLVRDLARWSGEARGLAVEAERLLAQQETARRLTVEAETTHQALTELRATVGASVRELEERLGVLRRAVDQGREQLEAHREEQRRFDREIGSVAEAVDRARADLTAHHESRLDALAGLAAVAGVPGLLESAFETAETGPPDGVLLTEAGTLPPGEPLPNSVLTLAETLVARSGESDDADVNVVWRAYNEAANGPAADHEPTVAEFGDLIAVTGRDGGADRPIAELAVRVTAGVVHDRQLLTQRERERFEQHVLGELGDAIRRCRLEADELVEAMNHLLAGVTTSQGIRVRLDWRLRDDVPAEARHAIGLLVQPVGALLPEERDGLRDALHRLIEASRAERPELAYGEHLAGALDYRTWFAFRIRYTRPESDGAWLDLHRRSPLSQGEQKVLCYLPLFAAAAAHFTSLAGAAPHAPRLILLDDAFPKIDVRTHPLLFGLLVQLDLDFVVTSERLWGDHDTVPSLAIYETLRDPSQRGIAQYEYRWDGRQLRSLG